MAITKLLGGFFALANLFESILAHKRWPTRVPEESLDAFADHIAVIFMLTRRLSAVQCSAEYYC